MVGVGVGHSAAKEEAMSMKASEVGEWLRKNTGKRDHHELMPQDYVVVRPGPNFHWLMGHTGSWARAAQHERNLSRQHLDRPRSGMTATEPERKTRQLKIAQCGLRPVLNGWGPARPKTVLRAKGL